MGKSSGSKVSTKEIERSRSEFDARLRELEDRNSTQLGLLSQLSQQTLNAQKNQLDAANLASRQVEMSARQNRVTQEAAAQNTDLNNNQQIRQQQLLSRLQARQLNQQIAEADKAAGQASFTQGNLISSLIKSRKTTRGV